MAKKGLCMCICIYRHQSGYHSSQDMCKSIRLLSSHLLRVPIRIAIHHRRRTPCPHNCRYREPTRPVQLILVLSAVKAVAEPDTPDLSIIPSAYYTHNSDKPAAFSASLTIYIYAPNPVIKCHHPCPSNNIPHGNPSSCLHLLNFEQYTLSRFQIPNPPKKTDRPTAISIHICRMIT